MGIIERSSDLESLANSVETSEGAVVLPAFTGLGSPHWDPYARGTIVGLSRGVNRAHLARAVVEAMSFQVRDVLDAMSASVDPPPSVLRVDGGASVMNLLLQLQADQTGIEVARPRSVESTGLGAARLPGLHEGLSGSLGEHLTSGGAGWSISSPPPTGDRVPGWSTGTSTHPSGDRPVRPWWTYGGAHGGGTPDRCGSPPEPPRPG